MKNPLITNIDSLEQLPSTLAIGIGSTGADVLRRISALPRPNLATLSFDPLNSQTFQFCAGGTPFTSWAGINGSADDASADTVERLAPILDTFDIVFITAGLGGGSGFEAAPTISRLVRRSGRFAVGILILPQVRQASSLAKAFVRLNEMLKACDSIILFYDHDEASLVPGISTDTSLPLSGRAADALAGLSDLVSRHSYLGVKLEDLRELLTRGHLGVMLSGQSTSSLRAHEAAATAVERSLRWIDPAHTKGALIHILSDSRASIGQVDMAMHHIYDSFPPDLHLLWGVTLDESREDFQVSLLVSGIDASSVFKMYTMTVEPIDDLEVDEAAGAVELELELDQMEA